MPQLHVMYDPHDAVTHPSERLKAFDIKVAILSVPKDLKSVDVYNLARRLAELLLEQL